MARDQLGAHPSQYFERSFLAVQTLLHDLSVHASVTMAEQRFAPVRLFPNARDFAIKLSYDLSQNSRIRLVSNLNFLALIPLY